MMAAKYIKSWVEVKESFSFFLPDGPEGRPFDNQYHVIDVSADGGKISIKLSGGIQFLFDGDVQCRDESCNLVINGFNRLTYKVDEVVIREFTEGDFCLCGF